MKPLLLDLFCGAGGCAMGYHRAGFEVLGVDHESQPNYPYDFVKADALMYLKNLISDRGYPEENGGIDLDDIVAIHASPPCQAFSALNRAVKADHANLIDPTRKILESSGKPWVIENVEGAPLRQPILLCGTMFGLRVRRHRLFEMSVPLSQLFPQCSCRNGVVTGKLVGHRCRGKVAPGRTKPPPFTECERRDAIDVPWMTGREARQAIPPAYTEFIGKQLLAYLG